MKFLLPKSILGSQPCPRPSPAPSPESPLCFWLRQNKKSRIFHDSQPWELGSFQGGVIQDKTHRDPSGLQGLEQRENSSTKIKGVTQDVTEQSHLSTSDRRAQNLGRAAPGAAPGDSDPGPGTAGGPRAQGSCSPAEEGRKGPGKAEQGGESPAAA